MVTPTLFALMLALAPVAGAEPAADPAPPTETSTPDAEPLVVEIRVQGGYHPDRIEVPAGKPIVLRFVRSEYAGCTREVVFPTRDLRFELPTNEPVDIDLGALEPGELPFHCGMHMVYGTLVVTGGE